jgi:pimeloyl-ACP methyl ester carboxylesterase
VHPTSPAHGYQAGFYRGAPLHITLALRGFAVFAFDQIGHGNRLDEAQNFYQRYPHWSLMGKTVVDIKAAVNALGSFGFIDQSRIYALGYGTGGMAALHAAALDERIAGVISVAGFNPMRLDTPNKGTGGIERWTRWIPLLPRLGVFAGNEERVPYDFHEIIASIAPRPVLIATPRFDYQANVSDLTICLAEARKVYEFLNASKHLGFLVVDDYSRFGPEMQNQVFDQIHKIASGSY